MLAHDNIISYGLHQTTVYPAMNGSTVTLVISPTFNTAGINELSFPTFMVGGTVVILPSRGWKPEKMADYIDRYGVTHTMIYPSMMEPFLAADARERVDLTSLRFVQTGGENVPPAILSRFRKRWRHFSVLMGYGSTESGCPTAIADDELDRHPGSVGRVTLGAAVRIQDGDGNPVLEGEVGEIWVAGGSVANGYWNAPELTAATVVDGWLNTGDLGFLDAEGYLYLRGRSRDLVISKGQNIYPAEIENVLSEHPDLLDFTVIGVPDEGSGEAVCAVVVATPDGAVAESDVISFVQERLASYKKPRYVVFVEEIPRNAGNKVIKREVVDLATGLLELVAPGGASASS